MWKRTALIAGGVVALLLIAGVGFTLHQRGQCVARAGLWYDVLPGGRVGLDPQQVDWDAARGPCGWAARFFGSGLHKTLHARAIARLPVDDSDPTAAQTAYLARMRVVDAILFSALPNYPYPVFEAGAGALDLYMTLGMVTFPSGEPLAAPPPAADVDAAIRMLQRRIPIERAAYLALLERARRGDAQAAMIFTMKGDNATPVYAGFVKSLHQTALQVTSREATESESVQRLRAIPGAVDHYRRVGEGIAALAALPDLPKPEPGEMLALTLTAGRAGNIAAQFVAYNHNSGVGDSAPPLSPADALRFLRNGAERGLAPAQYVLASQHLHAARQGETPENFRAAQLTPSRDEALRLFRAADAAGFKPATVALADGYLRGWFGAPDYDAALTHYERAVDR